MGTSITNTCQAFEVFIREFIMIWQPSSYPSFAIFLNLHLQVNIFLHLKSHVLDNINHVFTNIQNFTNIAKHKKPKQIIIFSIFLAVELLLVFIFGQHTVVSVCFVSSTTMCGDWMYVIPCSEPHNQVNDHVHHFTCVCTHVCVHVHACVWHTDHDLWDLMVDASSH